MTNQENSEIFWNEFSSGLQSFILSKVKNNADAEDILQEIYIKIHNSIDTLNDKTRIKSWIYQIARNMIIDYYRSKSRIITSEDILINIPGTLTEDKLMDTAISDMVKMMEKLSPEYCEALCLTEIEGMNQKEYAEKKGLSYSGAKSRVQRGRQMLKELLLNCCHYQFDKYGTVINIQPKCCTCCSMEK
jgi:RNA polymerase sigma-70 factor (ECF subfamily)